MPSDSPTHTSPLDRAARGLYDECRSRGMNIGAFNIWAWHAAGEDGPRLRVKIDPGYRADLSWMPNEYGGFPVTVEVREKVVAR